jgi:hypothetical protein
MREGRVPKTDWKVAELMPVAVEGADMPLKRKFFFEIF